MAIRGNVIWCDECGCQISMPMEWEGGKRSLDERVRAFAIGQGWICGNGVDFCPATNKGSAQK
jgi:hypothetical protein